MSKTIEISQQQLENSKIYVNPDLESVNFKHIMDYADPLFEALKGINVDYEIKVETGSQNKNDENDLEGNIAYSRFGIIAKMPREFDIVANDFLFKDLFGNVGILGNFDTKKPSLKAFRGHKVSVCMNQTVFGAENITACELIGSTKSVTDAIQRYVDTYPKMVEEYNKIIEKLTNTTYSAQMVNQKFGELVRAGINDSKIGTNPIISAIKSMTDPKSRYAVDKDGKITAWKAYNSITEEFKKVSIVDEPSKVLLLEKLFNN